MRTLRRLIFTAIGLVLAFIIGFFSSIVAFIGAGYIAYTKVSIDKLEELGVVDIDTNGILDPSAEVSLTALTVQGLIQEISTLAGMGETVTINYLIERYGLMLDDDVLAHIPEDLRDVPIISAFSMQGIVKIIGKVEIASILGPVLGEDSTILIGILAGKTFGDIIVLDEETGEISLEFGTLLAGKTIGNVLGYEPIYRDDEIIGWIDSEGQSVTGVIRAIASIGFDSMLNGGFDFAAITSDIYIGDVLNYTPVYDENGALIEWVDAEGQPANGIFKNLVSKSIGELADGGFGIDSILGEDAKIGDILGYTYDENSDKWLDGNGVVVSGAVSVFAGLTFGDLSDSSSISNKINEMQLADVLGYTKTDDGWVDSNGNEITGIMAVFADSKIGSIGSDLDNIQIGAAMGYELGDDDKWYNDDGEELTGVMAAFGDLTLSELSDGNTVTTRINSVKLADALGYTKTDDGWVDSNGNKLTGIMAVLADSEIGSIGSDLDSIKIGAVMGYELKDDGKWYNDDGEELTGVMASFGDLTISELSDGNMVTTRLNSVKLADVLSYTKNDDGWVDSNGNKVTGIMAVLADSQIGSIGSDLDNIEIGAVMGYELKEDGKWYNNDGEELAGVMAAFGDLTLSELSDSNTFTESLNSVKLADALGYTKTEDGWVDGNGQKVVGVMAILADTQIGNVSADMNNIQIGSIMGHEYNEEDGKWYQNGVELTGVMAAFADLTVNEMSDTDKVSAKMSEMFDSMTMGEYLEKGILDLDDGTVTTLDLVASGWRDQSINDFIPFLISKLANPTIPTT